MTFNTIELDQIFTLTLSFHQQYVNGMIFQMTQKMLLLWPHSNIDSTETLCHILSITMQVHVKDRYSKLDSDWSAVHLIQIFTENILFPVPPVSVVSFKLLLISSSTAQSIQTKDEHIYQTTSEPTQLKTSYLDVKMLQSKTINHSFCKFKNL